ncbi:MAG: ATP-binding protein [Gemmatimonadota bacterium]|jgi:signal transduction histidine kinase
MSWIRRLRALRLRRKVAITFGAVVALALAVSAVLSFRYWQREFLSASEEQAALAAASTRAALESTLPGGRIDAGRRSLVRLVTGASVSTARVYGPDGTILVSADAAEEGTRPRGIWIPAASELPHEGILRQSLRGDTVHAYLPLSLNASGDAVLELKLPVEAMRAAMERGAILGNGLMLLSFVALGLIFVTMLEREVVTPLHRMEHELADAAGEAGRGARKDEVRALRDSVHRLIEREREAEELAAARDRELEAREGMARVGELAAEMAHEFKRPLASIRTAMDLLEQEYALEEGGREVLGRMDQQLERLSETMRDLFSLARPVKVETQPVAVEEVVDDVLLEARGLPGAERVSVQRRFGRDLPKVPGDRLRLEQAFLNLVANAVEAMPDGGTLTATVEISEDGAVVVSFTDTGGGIAEEEIERAVRPFYSTKPLGTGLGLSLVARVVAAHRGALDIRSRLGEGTTVTVTLPSDTERERPLSTLTEAPGWRPNGY